MKIRAAIVIGFSLIILSHTAVAQTYPTKPIRIIVPYPPGGTSDILTRMIGPKLTESWGQSVLADSRPGAGGIVGVELLVRAPADGYTLVLMDVGGLTIAPSVFRKLSFDFVRDMAPVGMVSYSPHLLAAHPAVPANNVKELIVLAKKQPGGLNYATGLGSAGHFAGMLFTQRAGIKWLDVPGKGGQQSMLQVVTGECDLLFIGILQSIGHVRNGRAKALAISSYKRDPSLPNVPTVSETPGLEGFVTGSWQGILAPAKAPPDIIAKLNAEFNRIMSLPDMKEKLAAQGTAPLLMSPPEFGKWLVEQRDRWAKLVKDTGFKPLDQ